MKHFFLLAVMVCLWLPMMAEDKAGHKHDNAIGHSKKDLERNEDGRLTGLRTEQDGASAKVNVASSTSGFNLDVSRGVTNDVATTTLNYSDFDIPADLSSITFTNIFGTIPNDAFTGDNTKGLVLNLDASRLDPATSFSQRCTITFVPFSQSCAPGPLGSIHLEFRENGITRTRILELDEEQVAGPVTTRTHQRTDSSSANFQGTVFGVPVSSPQGTASIGVNHLSTVVITRQ